MLQVSSQHHLDYNATEIHEPARYAASAYTDSSDTQRDETQVICFILLILHARSDVGLWSKHGCEGGCTVMILQHGSIVIQDRERVSSIDVKQIGAALSKQARCKRETSARCTRIDCISAASCSQHTGWS